MNDSEFRNSGEGSPKQTNAPSPIRDGALNISQIIASLVCKTPYILSGAVTARMPRAFDRTVLNAQISINLDFVNSKSSVITLVEL